MIDFTPCGKSEAGQKIFEQNPGGAPTNELACLSKCGKKTAFIGKVGQDMHGQFLKGVLEDSGIITEKMQMYLQHLPLWHYQTLEKEVFHLPENQRQTHA